MTTLTEKTEEEILSPENQAILDGLIAKAKEGKLVGEFPGIPNEVYHHKDCPGFSKSKLDKIDVSWEHSQVKTDRTKALDFGCAFHDMILEPKIFAAKNTQGSLRPEKEIPKFGRKNVDKEEKKKFLEFVYNPWVDKVQKPWDERNEKKVKWSDVDWATLLAMKKAIEGHDLLQAILSKGQAEVTIFWVDKKTGLLCKCRPDWMSKDHGILLDLKSCISAAPKDFRKSIANFLYDKQASYYLTGASEATGIEFKSFLFAACEKSDPFGIALYDLDDASIEVGEQLWRRTLNKIVEIKKGKLDKGYPKAIQNINLPAWGFDIEAR